MSSPVENDPTLARFRRGARPPAGPPGPPPVVPQYDAAAEPASTTPASPPTLARGPAPTAQPPERSPWAPRDDSASEGASVPGRGWAADPARPLFGELVADPGEVDQAWTAVDDDPGRALGITAVAIGLFVGVIGVFVGIASVRRSRLAGRAGVTGYIGIAVSILSIVVFSVVGLSWLRYEISLAQQCSLVGPGEYLTQTGQQVSCG
jgi:hypothetical protein